MAFVDHHVHFVATAATYLSVDLTNYRHLGDLLGALGAAGGSGWLRAWGYDDALLVERRHPTRADLDRACGRRPVVVHHRTGHAAVLNSPALSEIGVPDHPDGVLFDRHDLLARVPRLDPGLLGRAARSVSRAWTAAGVGAFVDATHTNGPGELELLARWCRDGVVDQEVTAMVAPARVADLPGHGCRVGPVRIGHVKIMPGGMEPGLGPQVRAAHERGYPVAVHVTDVDVLEAALEALAASPPPPGTRDRIEHNALCLPEQVPRLAATGAVVVVNPSFLLHRRRKYELDLSEVERGWLIRIRSLIGAGITVRAGSDSPVAPALPAEIVAAATGHPFSPGESVDEETAVALLRPLVNP